MSSHIAKLRPAVVFVTLIGCILASAPLAAAVGKKGGSSPEAEYAYAVEQFMGRLEPEQLRMLAEQCDAERSSEPKKQVAAILARLEKAPDSEVRLTLKGGEHSRLELSKAGTYFLGGFEGKLAGQDVRQMDRLMSSPRYNLFLRIGRSCGKLRLLLGLTLTEPLILGPGAILVTDLAALNCEGGLQMGSGARIYGLHPCGLDLTASTLTGALDSAPMISTALRPDPDDDYEQYFDPIPGYEDLQSCSTTEGSDGDPPGFVRDGTDGAFGGYYNPQKLEGELGDPASCAAFATYIPPTAGEDMSGRTAATGLRGGDGTKGYAPRRLLIRVRLTLSGNVIFDTSGGNGGTGGYGGPGQDIQGGRGGSIRDSCEPLAFWDAPRRPGKGGDGGTGGTGGSGGKGGDGGDGGNIVLFLPGSIPGGTFTAVTRGGHGGVGGSGGAFGHSLGGLGGFWVDESGTHITALPDGSAGAAGSDGEPGATGESGLCGRNGSITLNGEVVVPGGTCGDRERDYTYPPPAIIASPVN